MEEQTKTTIATATTITFLVASIVLGANLIGQKNVYACVETGKAYICDKLSSPVNNISTRCYFFDEKLNKTTYKICDSGWKKFEDNSISKDINTTEDYICDDNGFIKECRDKNNNLILRVGIK